MQNGFLFDFYYSNFLYLIWTGLSQAFVDCLYFTFYSLTLPFRHLFPIQPMELFHCLVFLNNIEMDATFDSEKGRKKYNLLRQQTCNWTRLSLPLVGECLSCSVAVKESGWDMHHENKEIKKTIEISPK